jgi:hypothetical protein
MSRIRYEDAQSRLVLLPELQSATGEGNPMSKRLMIYLNRRLK